YKAEMGRLNVQNTNAPSFKDELGKALESKKEALQNYGKNNRSMVGMTIKAVGDMAAANTTISGTTTFSGNSQLGGIGRKPYESMHI
ncbi:hypothetical protein, partial [Xenorhabdus bovienii]|uniref:hypothetical protein n=1 Tax=Xenorhabdus bovienii TaxID=40576 RepID=UPI0023B3444E